MGSPSLRFNSGQEEGGEGGDVNGGEEIIHGDAEAAGQGLALAHGPGL